MTDTAQQLQSKVKQLPQTNGFLAECPVAYSAFAQPHGTGVPNGVQG